MSKEKQRQDVKAKDPASISRVAVEIIIIRSCHHHHRFIVIVQ
jgi:hypothetical protein